MRQRMKVRCPFYAIGNSVGIPYCIKKPYRAGLHCGGKVDVAEATRRRRRILQAGFFFIKIQFLLNIFPEHSARLEEE